MPTDIYKCEACEALVSQDNPDIESLYECPNCGELFTRSNSYTGDGHQCPSCHKFSSKVTDLGCPECQAGQLEMINGYACSDCDELFEEEQNLIDHIKEEHEEGSDDTNE